MTILRHSFTRVSCSSMAALLLLAGCGGGGDDPANPTPVDNSQPLVDDGANNPPPSDDSNNPPPVEPPPPDDSGNAPPAVNQAPSISGTPSPTIALGSQYTFLPSAQDPEGNSLAFSISNQPAWASFDSATGQLSGTPGSEHVGTNSDIVISVTDGTSTTSLPAFGIQVMSENNAPIITSTATLSVIEGEEYTYQVAASDPDVGSILNFSLANAPVTMVIDAATGMVKWSPTNDDIGTHTISVMVTDNGSPARSVTQTYTLNVDELIDSPVANAPAITSIAPRHAGKGTTFTYEVKATDPNAQDRGKLAYKLDTAPEGMTIDASTGIISWPVPTDATGTHQVTLTVEDPSKLKTSQTFALTIVLPRTGWLAAATSEEIDSEDGSAKNALDGNQATLWHTKWSTNPTPPPHEFQIDLGEAHEITGFLYLPRQDGGTGNIKQYQFYVSDSKDNWGIPVATGIFADNNAKEKLGRLDAPLTFKSGRYVKLVVLSEQTGLPHVSIAELNLLGSKATNRAPEVSISTPAAPITNIKTGESVDFSASSSDPEGGAVSYTWNFGDKAIQGSRAEDPGVVVFAMPGTYPVTLTGTDNLGRSSTDTRIVRVLNVSETLIPRESWTAASDSEEKVAEDGSAKNAIDGDPKTIWHTEWFNNAPDHNHNLTINLGGNFMVNGFSHLPRQDGPSGRIAAYKVEVSADGNTWRQVHTGTFANNASETKVIFTNPTDAMHIRLVSTSEVGGNPFASVAEFNVLGTAK